ncbi:uncharacterized protein LOC143132193 [Alosa pseudoharengus]|uniref:uncharacterized protein LOC143132193 n=1 Tax=Alosa pseudoharengus TaxID=34774 RepID=UPI003F8A0285
MGLFSFVILTHLLLKCYGHTYFYHQKDGAKITLTCETSGWQIDNQVDYKNQKMRTQTGPCSQGCVGEQNEQVDSGEDEGGTCHIEARSGFYTCVHDCNSQYPLKPHSDVVAIGDTRSEHVLPTQQNVIEGSPILLNCSFPIGPNRHYVIYWLKVNSGNGRATCISSHSREGHDHQICSENARFTSLGPSEHHRGRSYNVSTNSSRLSDSSVYVCVLNKGQNKSQREGNNDVQNTQDTSVPDTKDRKKDWIIIRNITVSVTRNGAPNPTWKTPGADVGWYVAGAVLLILVAVILLLAREKMKSNQARQSLMMQRSCHGDQGTTDPDCSPYAVGVRQHEPYSVVHIRTQPDCVGSTPAGPSGPSSDVPEPYSVVQLRTQPDSVGSTRAGQTADVPETYSVITYSTTQS